MAKKKTEKKVSQLHEGTYEIDTGTAVLAPDPQVPQGWILYVNKVPSTPISPSSAHQLEFDYMRYIAKVIEAQYDSSCEQKINFLHLGGGACALPRYLAQIYPHSRHVVVEIDGKLAVLARQWLDLPRAPRLRIRVGDAREVVENLQKASRDVVIRDVFAGTETPGLLTSIQYVSQVHSLIKPGGIYAVNCANTSQLLTPKQEIATLLQVFNHVCVIAAPALLKSKRNGNIVLIASDEPLNMISIKTILRSDKQPAQVLQTVEAKTFSDGKKILYDADFIF